MHWSQVQTPELQLLAKGNRAEVRNLGHEFGVLLIHAGCTEHADDHTLQTTQAEIQISSKLCTSLSLCIEKYCPRGAADVFWLKLALHFKTSLHGALQQGPCCREKPPK
jgi:hypothetical protein